MAKNKKERYGKSKIALELSKKVTRYIDPYSVRDIFVVSMGNLEVLKTIPVMMTIPKWRDRLRHLMMEFTCEETLKRNKLLDRDLQVMNFEQRMKNSPNLKR
jgi:hypothetical protein